MKSLRVIGFLQLRLYGTKNGGLWHFKARYEQIISSMTLWCAARLGRPLEALLPTSAAQQSYTTCYDWTSSKIFAVLRRL
jgi:hypothetical protein